MLAFLHALGDRDVQGAILDDDVALLVDLGEAQRHLALGALVGVLEVDLDLGVMVLSGRVELAAREAAMTCSLTGATGEVATAEARAGAATAHAAEHLLEEVGELRGVRLGVPAAGELEARVPVGRGTELLALLPVGAELIVGRALFGVFQDLVGFARVLELGFRALFLVDVGMIGARHLAVGALDLVLGGASLDAEDLVVVLVFHAVISGRS